MIDITPYRREVAKIQSTDYIDKQTHSFKDVRFDRKRST